MITTGRWQTEIPYPDRDPPRNNILNDYLCEEPRNILEDGVTVI